MSSRPTGCDDQIARMLQDSFATAEQDIRTRALAEARSMPIACCWPPTARWTPMRTCWMRPSAPKSMPRCWH
jgi:hypothetical protein